MNSLNNDDNNSSNYLPILSKPSEEQFDRVKQSLSQLEPAIRDSFTTLTGVTL